MISGQVTFDKLWTGNHHRRRTTWPFDWWPRPSLVPIQLVTGSRRTMIVHWPETGMFTRGSYYTFFTLSQFSSYQHLINSNGIWYSQGVAIECIYNEKDPDLLKRRTYVYSTCMKNLMKPLYFWSSMSKNWFQNAIQ